MGSPKPKACNKQLNVRHLFSRSDFRRHYNDQCGQNECTNSSSGSHLCRESGAQNKSDYFLRSRKVWSQETTLSSWSSEDCRESRLSIWSINSVSSLKHVTCSKHRFATWNTGVPTVLNQWWVAGCTQTV